jgi:hypothetical protein
MAVRPRFDPSTVGEGVARGKETTGINTGIEVDFGAFFPIMEQYPKLTQKVMPPSLNRTGLAAKTAASRALRGIFNIKQKRINKAIDQLKARRNSFLFQLRVRSRGIGLINFGARQTTKGVSYAILKGRRNTIKHAFKAPMLGIKEGESTREGVFIRKGKKGVPTKGRYKGRYIKRGEKKGQLLERQKLQRFIGPGPANMWGRRAVQDAFRARAIEFLPLEFNRRMTRELNTLIDKRKAKR